jgi:hypothetical protein
MNTIKSLFPFFVLIVLPSLCLCQEKPRIAVLQLQGEKTLDLEISVLTHLIENYFVNTNHYTVLERHDVDKVRREQAMADSQIRTDAGAAALGRLLNAQDIVIGTLMIFQGRYFCETRMISVATSSIEKSCTETCESNDDFAFAAKRIVEKITGGPVKDDAALVPMGKQDSTEPPATKEPPQLAQFRKAGLSSDDCDRFLKSGKTMNLWASQSRTSPLLAGCLGAIPLASGHYLTHNYGLALFFSLVKTLSLLGITQTHGKGSEKNQWATAYAVILSAGTLADIITSYQSAEAYNSGLNNLIRDQPAAVSISNPCHDPSLNVTITF